MNFSERYKDLICMDISKFQLKSIYETPKIVLSDKYRKKFIHTPEGFVEKYCKEYD